MWFDNSNTPEQKKVVKKPAVAAVVVKDNKFLVIDRPDGKPALPSGTGWVKHDETPEEGVKGEINYTLGIQKEDVVIKDNFQFRAGIGSTVDTIEVYAVKLKKEEIKLNPKAAKGTHWVSFEDEETIEGLDFEHPGIVKKYRDRIGKS